MSLRELILRAHSKQNTLAVQEWVGSDAANLQALIVLFLGKEVKVVQRSAWALSTIAEKSPALVQPFVPKIVDKLNATANLSDAEKRNILRLLTFVHIPPVCHDVLLSSCFELLANPKEAIAIRAFSMEVLARLVLYYPEIANELNLLINDELAQQPSPGFVSKAKKVLKAINKKA